MKGEIREVGGKKDPEVDGGSDYPHAIAQISEDRYLEGRCERLAVVRNKATTAFCSPLYRLSRRIKAMTNSYQVYLRNPATPDPDGSGLSAGGRCGRSATPSPLLSSWHQSPTCLIIEP